MNFEQEFNQYIRQRFPALTEPGFHINSGTVSPHKIEISKSSFSQIKSIVKAIFEVRNILDEQNKLHTTDQEILDFRTSQYSVLMGYDFHLTQDGTPKLIEINTNAAFALLGDVLGDFHGLPQMGKKPFSDIIFESFQTEFQLSGCPATDTVHCAIVDDNVYEQKTFFEFLMYQQLFTDWGWPTKIVEPQDLIYDPDQSKLLAKDGQKINLIYNRYCDFLLSQPQAVSMRRSYFNKSCCVSPHPREYLLLADKNRLIDLSQPEFLDSLPLKDSTIQTILNALPKTFHVRNWKDPLLLWKERKSYFFKPTMSYGGKAVYNGKSISKKVFEVISQDDFIAQQTVPPSTVEINTAEGKLEKYKYDLRVFVYKDSIQLTIARLYQGQLTNMRSPDGGCASVVVI